MFVFFCRLRMCELCTNFHGVTTTSWTHYWSVWLASMQGLCS